MRTSIPRIAVIALALALVTGPLSGCSNDEPSAPPGASLVGTWNATSFTAQGMNFIAQGMSLSMTLSGSGTYSFVVANDLLGMCSGTQNCTNTGNYTSTANQVTLDPGTDDEVVFNYTIQGTMMNWTGTIDGTPVSVSWTR